MSNTQEKRAELEAKAEIFKADIAEEISDMKQIAKERGMQIAVVGGVLAASYLLYSLFSGSDKKESSSKDESSFLGSALKSYAVALALGLAKDKLMAYLQSLESEQAPETKQD
jgi:hypothetical protein